jgi:hypothetical protein
MADEAAVFLASRGVQPGTVIVRADHERFQTLAEVTVPAEAADLDVMADLAIHLNGWWKSQHSPRELCAEVIAGISRR